MLGSTASMTHTELKSGLAAETHANPFPDTGEQIVGECLKLHS
jgi:hypothetical protein